MDSAADCRSAGIGQGTYYKLFGTKEASKDACALGSQARSPLGEAAVDLGVGPALREPRTANQAARASSGSEASGCGLTGSKPSATGGGSRNSTLPMTL